MPFPPAVANKDLFHVAELFLHDGVLQVTGPPSTMQLGKLGRGVEVRLPSDTGDLVTSLPRSGLPGLMTPRKGAYFSLSGSLPRRLWTLACVEERVVRRQTWLLVAVPPSCQGSRCSTEC